MLVKKLLNRTLLSLTGLMVATASQAFDAGASDPNFREFESLVGGTGSDKCRLEVGYLTASQNLTQLLIVTKRPTPYNQYHYNGGYYRSSNNNWSSDETDYFRSTTGVDADLTTVSPSTLASDCGWTSASITNLTPLSNFAANGTTFADAESASIRLDYTFNGRSFSATASISGAANAIPIAQTIYTGTPGAPTTLVATPQDGAASIAFTAPTDLPSGAGESANDIINYEYSLDGGQNWLAIPAVTTSPVTISGLTNGTTYSVTLRAINTIGTGITSSSVAVTPVDTTACVLSGVDTSRQLTNNDTAAITQAAKDNADITGCDVSGITDMEGLFYFHPNTFNQDIGGWDVSNVTNMKHMFRQAYVFNQDISEWQTGSVTNMERMFTFSYEFNQDISDWNVSNVTNLFATFESARALNQDFTGWDVSNVTTFQGMFMNATAMLARGAPSTPNISFFNDASAPTIASTSINTANTELTVTFSESVYDTTGGTGDLEVADFALSISGGVATLGSATPTSITKTSQSVWVLGFSTTGTANGSETITVVPASSTSIYDAAANAAATSQSNNTASFNDASAPTIASTSINTANTELTVTFSESVYDTTGGTGDLEVADFALSISGGVATLGSATPTSITKTSQSVWVLGFSTTGTANGSETITVVPASSTSIYDAAANAAATSQSNNTVTLGERVAPTVTLTGPSGVVTAAFTVTATFSEAVTGFALDDITAANGTASSLVTGNAPVYTFTVTPTLGTTVSISIAANKVTDTAGNANTTSNTLSIQAGSPASEFEKHKTAIKPVITGEAKRALRSSLASDQRMVRNSLNRFIADQSGPDANQDVAFFVDGSAKLKATHLDAEATAKGNFFSQQATGDGAWRKLAFGDFDVQTDDAKNVSGFLKGRMAFETNLNSTTMLGYFVGGQLGRSTLKGTFEGSQNSFGASVGGYLVQTLAKDVYADLFASLGANRNTLKLSNGTLDLDSFYSTVSSTLGGSVTGVYDMDGFEVWPALTFTYGKTNVGNVDFTGVAYGLTDTTLSLDAGKVHLASLSFTPEIRMPFELQESSDTSSMATFAPRYTCEQTSSNSSSRNCGSGAAIGLTTASDDGLTNLNAQFQYDKVGSTARRSLQLGFERRF